MDIFENFNFNEIIARMKMSGDFEYPLIQNTDTYFLDFLTERLDSYVLFYKEHLYELIDEVNSKRGNVPESTIFEYVSAFSESIKKSISLFYKGDVLAATEEFNSALTVISSNRLLESNTIDSDKLFYRARVSDQGQFSRKDLFHVNFKLRHVVSTNRYSISGFPALYLGDSTYVCWEEFNRPRLRELFFSKFRILRKLEVVEILRFEDFLNKISDPKLNHTIFAYLVTYPLIIACSIKVLHPKGNFKPEYIISQLLLQYISKNDKIDGIRFPSTKVDYSKISGVDAYNYVFPVKEICKEGFCNKLANIFHLTEPTSLELEEIIYNPHHQQAFIGVDRPTRQINTIELIEGIRSDYKSTSFGKIEDRLIPRDVKRVC